jgi:hypothetical protein
MKKTFLLIIGLTLMIFFPISARALEIRTENNISIGADQTIEGNLYAAGNNLNIEGTINGDVFFAGQNLNIEGNITGDVFAASQSILINGNIKGSLRAAGDNIIINGNISQNTIFIGSNFELRNNGNIGWDLLLAGASADIKGQIGRNLQGIVSQISISGIINEKVKLKIENKKNADNGLKISQTARIGGDLNYSSGTRAEIHNEAEISGEINFTEKASREFNFFGWGFKMIFSIFAAFVVGLVLISLWKKQLLDITETMKKQIPASIGWGLLLMILSPIVCIVLLFTLIGIPLALIIFTLWLIILYISKIFAGILLGRTIVEKIRADRNDSLILSMIIGISIAWLIFSIPFFGQALSLLAVWWGFGGLWLYFRKN